MKTSGFSPFDRETRELEEFYQKKGISGDELTACIENARKKIDSGYPIAYIVGEMAFYNLVFKVTEDVLIPRPDTERVVEKAISLLPRNGSFADLCTGSGCIALTLLYNRADIAKVVAVELSPSALAVAKENAARTSLSDRIEFIEGDIFENPLGEDEFDIIISNPPYIPTEDIAKYPSLVYEPKMALDGGVSGGDFYKHIIESYRKNLKENGCFVFEIGFDQKELIEKLAASVGMRCETFKDYGGNWRVAVISQEKPKNKPTESDVRI